MRVGIVAPSGVVPKIEFQEGVAKLSGSGFEAVVHPQCFCQHLFYAGTDEERSRAFYESASDPSLDIIWAARGGYGATRILPWLEKMTEFHGIPKHKLFVGYSDATALMAYVKDRWGWSTLHAPMPGVGEFSKITPANWSTLLSFLNKRQEKFSKKLNFLEKKPSKPIIGEVVGGNLAVIASMVGTPFALDAKNKILFLEEVSEAPYRIDRFVQQLAWGGSFEGVKAIVLGTFSDCDDIVFDVLADRKTGKKKPLRAKVNLERSLEDIFGFVEDSFGIPIAMGLSVGHGGGNLPLPLGAQYKLSKDGDFELSKWSWLSTRQR
ncbi:MAG: hypothetical protein A3K03_05830 [Bdellovibrionales bacterium RIFOXYD1_FULL_44_7]|nr:MAG: hypothetical protein A3K03_05830 [Bdellovibrionales bacterium RIFOXYD1_FULL_44_7]